MSDLSILRRRLHLGGRELDREVGEARMIATAALALQTEIAELSAAITLHDKVALLLAGIGEQRQNAVQQQIETLVTQGLQTIFGDGLSFHLVTATRAKTPVIDFIVRSYIGDTVVDTDVMEARGGGLTATVGFLLRLVVLLLSRHRSDSVLFLDETFTHVSKEYLRRVAEFLRQLVDATGVQVVLVTHSKIFAEYADRSYGFELVDGLTEVTAQ